MPQQALQPGEILALPILPDEIKPLDNTTPPPAHGPRSPRWIAILSAILLTIILIGGAFAVLNNQRSRITYQSQAVMQGALVLTIKATGPLQAYVYNVNFTGTGKLVELDVKVGQQVEKNQTLAKLDPTLLQNALNEAKAQVQAAQTALDSAKANYKATSTATAARIVAAQIALRDAQSNLKKVQTQSKANISAAQTTLSNAQTTLKKVQAQTQAQLAVAYDQEQQAIHACHINPNPPPHCVELATHQFALAQARAAAQVAAAQSQVNSAQSTLNFVKTQADTQNTFAQSQVNAAQNAINTVQTQGAAQKTAVRGQVNVAQSQLNTAQVRLQIAQYNLNNTILKASHAGTVALVNGTVGGIPGVVGNNVAGNNNLFALIVDLSSLHIQTSVNEADIGGVAAGEKVQFSVSAYGDRLFKGKVIGISPLGQTVSDLITYSVLIDVDTKDIRSENLLPGMTGNVTIIITERPNVFLVPVRAVNFAHAAVNPSSNTNNRSLIDQRQMNDALAKAQQMLFALQQGNFDVSKDNPTAAFVLERINDTIIVKPVVVGLTDGTSYEVLVGLSTADNVLVGAQN